MIHLKIPPLTQLLIKNKNLIIILQTSYYLLHNQKHDLNHNINNYWNYNVQIKQLSQI